MGLTYKIDDPKVAEKLSVYGKPVTLVEVQRDVFVFETSEGKKVQMNRETLALIEMK